MNQKVDPINTLPVELGLLIFSFLEAKDLLKCQQVSKIWFKRSDDWHIWSELCLQIWKGKLYKNNHKHNFVYNKPTEEIKMTIREMKEILRKENISYQDCLTFEDFKDKIKQVSKPVNVKYNYLDPNYGVKRLKQIYYQSLRYAHRKTISPKDLVENQWMLKFKHDEKNPMFPEFQENGNFLINYGANLMKWQIVNGGYGVQVEHYPILTVTRTNEWGFILENNYCTISVIDTKRRINLYVPQNAQYRLKLSNDIKDEANALFKDGEYENSLLLYKSIFHYLKAIPQELAKELLVHRNVENPYAKELVNLKVTLCLNVSSCFFKMKIYDEALASAQRALRFDPNSIKGLVRRGQAFYELKNYKRAKIDLETVAKKLTDPFVTDLLKKCNEEIKREEKFFESVAKAE